MSHLVIATIAIVAAFAMAWEYVTDPPGPDASVNDELTLVVELEGNTPPGSGGLSVDGFQDFDANSEHLYMRVVGTAGVSVSGVRVGLTRYDSDNPWQCQIGDTSARLRLREFHGSADESTVSCTRKSPVQRYSGGVVYLQMTEVRAVTATDVGGWRDRLQVSLDQYLEVPAGYAIRDNSTVRYRSVIIDPDAIEPTYTNFGSVDTEDPESDATPVISAIDTNAEASVERRAWVAALVAGYGAGLLPTAGLVTTLRTTARGRSAASRVTLRRGGSRLRT